MEAHIPPSRSPATSLWESLQVRPQWQGLGFLRHCKSVLRPEKSGWLDGTISGLKV